MKILALEFSSPQRSVAVADAATRASEVVETGPDGARALAMVADALKEAGLEPGQIECLAVGIGPGSYTGIRAAISLAQGWQLARGVRLLGISSAECVAWQAWTQGLTGRVTVAIDAQRDEVYLSRCELGADGCRKAGPVRLATLTEARECERAGDLLVGPEVTRWFPAGRTIFPAAAVLATLAANRHDFVTGDKLEPIYLRVTSFAKAPPSRVVP
jgi:tRNA threonylcarbamoyl adenosine modification protein YeaZ